MTDHADTIRDDTDHIEAAIGRVPYRDGVLAKAQLDALLAESQRLRGAALYARATLRGMLSDPNVTRSIDLRPEIEMLDRALAGEKVPDAMP